MTEIKKYILINPAEIKITFITSSGPGGQNVNKVATAVQLRFNVMTSASLPEDVRARLVILLGKKLTGQGELIIKASRHRTQERNKQDALGRLNQLVTQAILPPKKRRKTRPTLASKKRRLSTKKIHGVKKALRQSRAE